MIILLLGVILFCGLHLVLGLAPGVKTGLVEKLGATPFKGLFSVAVFLSVALIVLGWRAAEPVTLYQTPDWGRWAASVCVLLAFILFAATYCSSNIKRFIRHPQLTGVVLWGLGHLLASGDTRSLVLFALLGLWAIAEMCIISRRDGSYSRPPAVPLTQELKPVLIGLAAFIVIAYIHL